MTALQIAACVAMLASAALFYLQWERAQWTEVEPEPEPEPEPSAFPLVLPARAGWGTRCDLAMTHVFVSPYMHGPRIVPDRIIDVG